MAALTSKRAVKQKKSGSRDVPVTAATYYQGSLICWDTSVGRCVKGAASTTLRPIGLCAEDKVVANNGDPLTVNLFREITTVWMPNSATDAVVAADRGGLCYIESDQNVAHTDSTNTLSVAGIVWAVDATKGVEVEPRFSDSRLGGLDA